MPVNGDAVRIPATSTQPIISGLNQSAVTLASVIVEEGAPAIGVDASGSYLQIGVSGAVRIAGGGLTLLDFGASTVDIQTEHNSLTPAPGYASLYLKGTGIGNLSINGGNVALAWRMGEVSTATNIRVCGPSCRLWSGSGVTNTTVNMLNGTAVVRHAISTLYQSGGLLTTQGSGTVGTAYVYGGIWYSNSTGVVSTTNIYGGTLDTLTCGLARTMSAINIYGGVVKIDKTYITGTIDTVGAVVLTGTTPTTV